MTKWGTSTDGSFRAAKLAPTENDLKQAIDDIVVELGTNPSGTYPTVQARLDALVAATPGMKLSVRAATTVLGSYTFATSFQNGSVVDGVTLATGNSILITSMADKTQNGVYTVNATGAPTRRADFAASGDFPGAAVLVREGTVNKARLFYVQNTSAPNLGTSNIVFLSIATRPVEVTIGAVGAINMDFICDGVGDEAEMNSALFLIASGGGANLAGGPLLPTAVRGTLRLGPGDFVLSGPVALSFPNSGHGVEMVGAGREVTRILRNGGSSTDAVAVDVSGASTGSRSGPMRIADLKFVGSTAPHTNPAIKAYFAQDLRLERVDFASMQSIALVGVELQDSVLTGCRFASIGSSGSGLRTFAGTGTGAGGRPAILLLGDTDTVVGGHTTLGCTNVTVSESTFTACVDGALVVHGNAAAENFAGQSAIEHSGIALRNVRFDVSAGASGWAPQVYVYRARNVSLDVRLATGSNFAGGSAQALIDCDTVSGLSVPRYYLSTGANQARCGIRLANVTGFDWTTIYLDMGTAAFTQGVVEFSGAANTLVRRGTIARLSGATGYTAVVGTPATEFNTSGTANVAIGGTTVSVNHRLPRAPVDGEVVYAVVTRPSGGTPDISVTYNATQLTFTVTPAVAGSALVLAWHARVGDGG
jgi:hypothetical protein